MEINISQFFNNAAPMDYSASVAEIGNDAGRDTWNAACEDSTEYNILDNAEKRELFREFVRGFGAWDDSEIAAWTDVELNALCIQFISGDMREAGLDEKPVDWEAYEEDENSRGNIFRGDDGEIYYYVGN